MIDLHTHVLPGVDDGATDLDAAVQICRAAREDGCTVLVATPHSRHPSFATPGEKRCRALLSRLQSAVGSSVELHLGAEIRVDDQLIADLGRRPDELLVPLAGTRSLLLEFPYQPAGHDPMSVVHELIVGGWRPIVAHPERIPWLATDLQLLDRMVQRGALLQLTAASLLGDFGPRVRSICRKLLDRDLVHVLASDCHGVEWRPPGMAAARRSVERRWGSARASALTLDNPSAILADRPVVQAA